MCPRICEFEICRLTLKYSYSASLFEHFSITIDEFEYRVAKKPFVFGLMFLKKKVFKINKMKI